ncbi:hypothetical protein L3C95_29875 [Chitinophaga filiformis]|uniref:hypothetical protein n=1 Tax=Chitinophaga filiformis TaxID=104663 RepID=UPI001F3CDABF|nr:hypothetical protein [Chitinophaga filiformis]MCF6407142.1 hypothetical protein [Chitinophaga filiformis]
MKFVKLTAAVLPVAAIAVFSACKREANPNYTNRYHLRYNSSFIQIGDTVLSSYVYGEGLNGFRGGNRLDGR